MTHARDILPPDAKAEETPTMIDAPGNDVESAPDPHDSWSNLPPRRSFLTKAAAVVVGGIVGVVPAIAGLLTVLDPVRRKAANTSYQPVTTLDALPDDGKPRLFVIRADLIDGWTKIPDARIGAVFLARTGDKVRCLSVICPHAGCFVNLAGDGSFKCPCHDSEFETDGTIRPKNAQGQATVSPRDLDTLDVKIENGQVLVKFEKYRAGTPEKIPQA